VVAKKSITQIKVYTLFNVVITQKEFVLKKDVFLAKKNHNKLRGIKIMSFIDWIKFNKKKNVITKLKCEIHGFQKVSLSLILNEQKTRYCMSCLKENVLDKYCNKLLVINNAEGK